jgi:hypothetical protein
LTGKLTGDPDKGKSVSCALHLPIRVNRKHLGAELRNAAPDDVSYRINPLSYEAYNERRTGSTEMSFGGCLDRIRKPLWVIIRYWFIKNTEAVTGVRWDIKQPNLLSGPHALPAFNQLVADPELAR